MKILEVVGVRAGFLIDWSHLINLRNGGTKSEEGVGVGADDGMYQRCERRCMLLLKPLALGQDGR